MNHSNKNFLKTVLITIAALTSLAASSLLFSCNSTNQESPQENTTTVNTKIFKDGNLYTTTVFEKITSLKACHLKTGERFDISLDSISYNPSTTKLSFTMPKDIPYKKTDLVFMIIGVPVFPAELILNDAVYKRAMPGVFVNGKKAVEGKDYTLDVKTNHLKFLIPVDADKDSYSIIWLHAGGVNNLSNLTSKYEKEYSQLEKDWYRSIK